MAKTQASKYLECKYNISFLFKNTRKLHEKYESSRYLPENRDFCFIMV